LIYQPSNQKKLAAEINVVPYIDVMLVLLIIFMILSPLLIQGVDVDLPQTDTTKMSIESEPMVVSINDEGKYFLNLGDESISISLVELKSKGQFWLAEEYHQDFAERNELKYKFYRFQCGRDQRLDKLWGDNARSTNLWNE